MSFPPLSRTASRILDVVGNPDVDVDQMAEIINQDPALTARILGLANSAYFGQIRAIATVREAIIRVLGLNMVKSLAISISMAGVFNPRLCKAFILEDYWYRALGGAMLARLIAQRISPEVQSDTESVYLCGLLHNLGELLLAHVFPDEFSKALEAVEEAPASNPYEMEREYVGIDQVQAGELLMRRWHLPDGVIEVIGSLELMDYQGRYRVDLEVVRSARSWISGDTHEAPPALMENRRLISIPGLDRRALSLIQEQFLDQREALRDLARVLA
ncbi:MAG: HDOD domain-containing protein [Gammaproteobacteria bacterium]|nr:HDOD domain-containing protein [Gammaproteobacteria bacterium]